jgi:TRAP-type C4-dicarboxylate transport system substrate-binding protein
MSFRRTLISLAAVTLTSLAVAFPLNASAQTVLKAADVHPAGYPNVVAMENLGKKLEAATNGGKYKLQMFPGGVLGSEKEMIEQTQIGAIHIARISLGPMGPLVPEVNVFNMPFVFRDEAHMRAGDRRPDRQGAARQDQQPARPGWSRWAGWTAARAASTPRRRSSRRPT